MPIDPSSTSDAASVLAGAPTAFCCSKACPGDLILKAQDCANARGPNSATVVGGFYTPIERDVLRILLRGPASVISVLARAVQGNSMSPTLKIAVTVGTAQIISPFPAAHTRTTAATAEARKRHIVTLCRSVLLAYAAPGRKTEALASVANARGLPIQTPGSPADANFINMGATPLIALEYYE